jgi:hypothetical protein
MDEGDRREWTRVDSVDGLDRMDRSNLFTPGFTTAALARSGILLKPLRPFRWLSLLHL